MTVRREKITEILNLSNFNIKFVFHVLAKNLYYTKKNHKEIFVSSQELSYSYLVP